MASPLDLDQLCPLSTIACSLSTCASYHEAGQVLIAATAGVNEIILTGHHETLTILFMLVIEDYYEKGLEIAFAIFRHLPALGNGVHKNDHPLRRTYERLASVCFS